MKAEEEEEALLIKSVAAVAENNRWYAKAIATRRLRSVRCWSVRTSSEVERMEPATIESNCCLCCSSIAVVDVGIEIGIRLRSFPVETLHTRMTGPVEDVADEEVPRRMTFRSWSKWFQTWSCSDSSEEDDVPEITAIEQRELSCREIANSSFTLHPFPFHPLAHLSQKIPLNRE